LPGFQPDDLIGELLKIVEDTLDIDVIRFDPGPGPSVPNMGLFDTLARHLKEADPNGTPVPHAFECRHRWAVLFPNRYSDLRLFAHAIAKKLQFHFKRFTRLTSGFQ